jgi:hypothetical protein
METNASILIQIGQFLDWAIKVIMIITFFVIAYRIKVIMDVVKTYTKNEFIEPTGKKDIEGQSFDELDMKHIICPDSKCKYEFDINPLKTKEKGKTVCPKCREIIFFGAQKNVFDNKEW